MLDADDLSIFIRSTGWEVDLGFVVFVRNYEDVRKQIFLGVQVMNFLGISLIIFSSNMKCYFYGRFLLNDMVCILGMMMIDLEF